MFTLIKLHFHFASVLTTHTKGEVGISKKFTSQAICIRMEKMHQFNIKNNIKIHKIRQNV